MQFVNNFYLFKNPVAINRKGCEKGIHLHVNNNHEKTITSE